MTFLEQAKKNGHVINDFNLMHTCCPYQLGLEKETCDGNKTNEQCEECWNREMPNTKQNVAGMSVIPQSEIDAWHNAHESGKAEGYEQGSNDVWELVKKIVLKAEKGGLNYDDFKNIFGVGDYVSVLEDLTPQEALAKLKAYESAQKIEVGDVVELDGHVFVVNAIRPDSVLGFDALGEFYEAENDKCKKTGKHIDIQSILKQIG